MIFRTDLDQKQKRQQIHYWLALFTFLSTTLAFTATSAMGSGSTAQDQSPSGFQRVSVEMEDGVKLAADLFLPSDNKRFPTILIRTPYGASDLTEVGNNFAASGYAVLIQELRGMGGSEGDFFPFINEKDDGASTIEWIVKQPWSDGNIGIWGISYLGYSGFMMLASGHPSIKAFVSSSGWAEIEPFLSRNGAFRLMAQLTWFMTEVGDFQLPPVDIRSQVMGQIFRTTPLNSFFEGAEDQADRFQSLTDEYSTIDVPILHVTGWHDYINRNSIDAYEKIVSNENVSDKQHLVIGPWYHNQEINGGTVVGDEDFGSHADMGFESFLNLSTRWFDHWVKGIDNGVVDEAPVRLFLMGRNEWIDSTSWPPPDVVPQKWYISSTEGANSINGDGLLSQPLPSLGGTNPSSEYDTFVYDPNDPVPTLGGVNLHYYLDLLGVRDQRSIEERRDVLVYTSTPLDQNIEIVGPLKVVLYASSEGVDTDFTAKLVVVRPDGYARIVEDGILRCRFRNSLQEPEMMEPGKVYRLEIDLGATAIEVEQGSRLRLEISSSNFPKYDRNPNTGIDPFEAVEFRPVEQKVYFTGEYSSHLILPIRNGGTHR